MESPIRKKDEYLELQLKREKQEKMLICEYFKAFIKVVSDSLGDSNESLRTLTKSLTSIQQEENGNSLKQIEESLNALKKKNPKSKYNSKSYQKLVTSIYTSLDLEVPNISKSTPKEIESEINNLIEDLKTKKSSDTNKTMENVLKMLKEIERKDQIRLQNLN
jgi:hypothetical protein